MDRRTRVLLMMDIVSHCVADRTLRAEMLEDLEELRPVPQEAGVG